MAGGCSSLLSCEPRPAVVLESFLHFILIDGDGCSPASTNPHRCVHQVSSRVVSMALSPAEDLLALSLSSNQIMSISLSQADAKDDTVFAPVGAGGPPPGGDSRLVGHVCMCAYGVRVTCMCSNLHACLRAWHRPSV